MEARRRAAKKKKLKKMGKSKSTDTEEEEQEEDMGDDGKKFHTFPFIHSILLRPLHSQNLHVAFFGVVSRITFSSILSYDLAVY